MYAIRVYKYSRRPFMDYTLNGYWILYGREFICILFFFCCMLFLETVKLCWECLSVSSSLVRWKMACFSNSFGAYRTTWKNSALTCRILIYGLKLISPFRTVFYTGKQLFYTIKYKAKLKARQVRLVYYIFWS